jgi:hypothetical protein
MYRWGILKFHLNSRPTCGVVDVQVNIIEVKSFENRNSEGGTYFDLQDGIRTEEQLACI